MNNTSQVYLYVKTLKVCLAPNEDFLIHGIWSIVPLDQTLLPLSHHALYDPCGSNASLIITIILVPGPDYLTVHVPFTQVFVGNQDMPE